MKPKKDRLPRDFSPGSFKAEIVRVNVIVAAIAFIWLAFSWALNRPGAPDMLSGYR